MAMRLIVIALFLLIASLGATDRLPGHLLNTDRLFHKKSIPLPHAQSQSQSHSKRQLPADAAGVTTITTPGGVSMRYSEPGTAGICETTPGVSSYSGYIDVAPDVHIFFWFFEARHNAAEAPVTLWLNGGPGSDSLIGLFQELGPCNVTKQNVTRLNPYAWNEVSNMLFLSQPVGVGFSYGSEEAGTRNNITGDFQNSTIGGIDGRYAVINASAVSTTELAAIATWEVLQGFYSVLPQLDSNVTSTDFHLWTESYGGHYGPAFYNYFYNQNLLITNKTISGKQLNFGTLGIINGIIDELIQAPYYPEMAVNNTYGIKAVNDTVYSYMRFACYMKNGCLEQTAFCQSTNETTVSEQSICAEAANMCRDNVESPYYYYGNRGVYDIRHPYEDPTPPTYFVDFLNEAATQQALGVNLNYTMDANNEIYFAFQQTGDFVYKNFLDELTNILDNGVRVALIYGDADYICNWFGGQAVSLAINYSESVQFRSSEYQPFVAAGTEYGEVRQYGNFSFMRMYEAGHEVPYYQPLASLEAFRRVLLGLDLASGTIAFGANYTTNGTAAIGPNATHTETFVSVSATSSGMTSGTASVGAKSTSGVVAAG
ncbi:MAG: hypothetical protein M1835_002213, partial [Candelina submexicana]